MIDKLVKINCKVNGKYIPTFVFYANQSRKLLITRLRNFQISGNFVQENVFYGYFLVKEILMANIKKLRSYYYSELCSSSFQELRSWTPLMGFREPP